MRDGVMMEIRRSIGLLALLLASAGGLSAQEEVTEPDPNALEARIWLDRGEEPLLQRGDRVRIYYRASAGAYMAIFHIDTDGAVQLLHPRAPDDDSYARGGRDYRLLFPQSPYWFVDEYPGKGYFFLIASPEPFDFSSFDYARFAGGWDLTSVGRAVYQDPYVAIDEYVARLLPDWETVPYALDFISYDVGETHEYPRFLCYDCHGFQSYASWNPYTYACSSFRVVIWDDPYFYPAYRYRGTRVVFAQPPRGIARFEFKERARGEAWSPIVRTRQPPLRGGAVGYREPAVAAPAMPEFVPPRRRVVPSDQLRNDRGAGTRAGTRAGTVRPPSSTRSAQPRGGSTPSGVLPGRGSVQPSTPTRGTPTRGAPASATRPSRGVTPTPTTPSSRRATPLPGRTDARAGTSRTPQRPTLQRRPSTPTRSGGGASVVRPPTGGSRPSTRGSTSGSSGARAILPSRPSTSRPSTSRPSTSRPSTSRPSTSRPSTSRSRPTGRPTGRPTVRTQPSRSGGSPARSSRPAARPPARSGGARTSAPKARKPGGGRATPPKRGKPGGGA